MLTSRLPTFLTVKEFLQEYPVGRTRLYQDIRQGRIRIVKSGARTLIPSAELDRLREAAAPPSARGGHDLGDIAT